MSDVGNMNVVCLKVKYTNFVYCINLKLVVVLRVLSELRVLLSVLSVEKKLSKY